MVISGHAGPRGAGELSEPLGKCNPEIFPPRGFFETDGFGKERSFTMPLLSDLLIPSSAPKWRNAAKKPLKHAGTVMKLLNPADCGLRNEADPSPIR
jgi:hypothetical protein